MANSVRRTRISLLLSSEDILKSLSFQFGSGRNKKYLIMGIYRIYGIILWLEWHDRLDTLLGLLSVV